MRFVTNGPDVPDRLVQAHEEGRVVFFCGTGISYPAGLPDFAGLVDGLFEALGEDKNSAEQAAIRDKRYDLAIGLLEGRIQKLALVRPKLRDILTPKDLSKPKATESHRALLTLAKTRGGETRIVTTNFDRIFCAVEPNLRCFAAPLLPIPKKSRWDGIVYLHGLLPEDNNASALNNLVVSSGDFGLAYLTERWASRFVTELLTGYTVCFVGYSIHDPVLRYMVDALSADRIRGEAGHEVFAFGAFASKERDEVEQTWRSKGVTPILYDDRNDHEMLHGSLREWSAVYRDGLNGKCSIITQDAAGLPSHVEGDGQISRVLWAIMDPSGQPAKAFAELNPIPPVEWLAVFNERRFTEEDLPRFGILAASRPDHPITFSLLNHPTPYDHGKWMMLCGNTYTIQGAAQLDPVMIQIAHWLGRHLDKPEVLRWVVTNGSSLHPRFSDLISRDLKKDDLPRPLSTIWRLVCARLTASDHGPLNFFEWISKFKHGGWSVGLRMELRDLLQPLVHFREAFHSEAVREPGDDNEKTPAHIPRINDYVNWEIKLRAGENFNHFIADLKKMPEWSQAVVDCLSDFTTCLRDALDLMAELERASEWSDHSYASRPSIGNHPQNHDYYEWTTLIELCRDGWLAAAQHKPNLARSELERWKSIRYPLFRRLVFFAAANSTLVPAEDAITLLLEDQGRWLWASETRHESLRLLIGLAPRLDEILRSVLFGALLAGPTPAIFQEDMEDDDWKEFVDHAVWLRLSKIKTAGAGLTSEADDKLGRLSTEHPSWRLERDDRDEFAMWMESGARISGRERIILPRERIDLAKAVVARLTQDHWYEDDWREVCQKLPKRAITTLIVLANQKNWPISAWREALQTFSEGTFVKLSLRWLAPHLLHAPNAVIQELSHTLSWWLEVAANIIVSPTANETWLKLIDRILDCTASEEPVFDEDPVGRAINHPVGHVAQALINWWYRLKPKAGLGFIEPLKIRFKRMVDSDITRLPHGRVVMAAHVNSLFGADPYWTSQNLLLYFDWNAGSREARAVWEGYLWSPRISADLLDAFKASFLATAGHYNDLGKHNGQFASLMTIAALSLRDHFTPGELRDAFNALPPEGLAEAARMLSQMLSDAGEQREEYWKNRVKPLISDVWPKSADRRSGEESMGLALAWIRCRSLFQEAGLTIQPLLRKSTNYDLPVIELAESNLARRYPLTSLELLDSIVDEACQWPPKELTQCLEQIVAADPDLRSNPKYSHLKEYVDRF